MSRWFVSPPADQPPLSSVVAVFAGPEDQAAKGAVSTYLTGLGMTVVEDVTAADAIVVLLSPSVVPLLSGLVERATGRLVVLRLAPVDEEDIPRPIAEINWVLQDAEHPETAFPALAAALTTDPGNWGTMKRLRAAVTAWVTADRNPGWLVDDWGQYLEFHQAAAGAGPLPPDVQRFLSLSRQQADSRRSARRRRRVVALLALVAAVGSALYFIPQLQLAGQNNRQAFRQMNDPVMTAEMPAWKSLLGGALMLSGTTFAERELGHRTVLETVTRPWGRAGLDVGPGNSVEYLAPFDDPSRVLAIKGDDSPEWDLTLFDADAGMPLWDMPLPGIYTTLTLSPDAKRVAAAGPDGVVVVDLDRREVVAEARGSDLRVWNAVWLPDGRIAILTADGVLVAEPGGRELTTAAPVPAGTAVDMALHDGRLIVLTSLDQGAFVLTDGLTGEELARGRVPEAVWVAGAVDLSGRGAFVSGGDHQVWRLGLDGSLTPTGVPTSDRTAVLVSLAGDRLAVGGEADRVRVYDVPGLLDLGMVCHETPRLIMVTASASGDHLACLGEIQNSLWTTPDGPRDSPGAAEPGVSSSPYFGLHTAEDTGRPNLVVRHEGDLWGMPVPVDPAAISVVSFSPQGDQVAIGDQWGRVLLYAAEPGLVTPVSRTQLPMASAVDRVDWHDGNAVVHNSAGWWTVPGCPDCTDPDSALALLIARLATSGCWLERQMADIEEDVRKRLDLTRCRFDPPPVGED
jgi:hypothetical protein